MPLDSSAAQSCAQLIVNALNIPPDAQAEGLNKWTTVVNSIFETIVAQALVVPTALISAAPGAPVTGIGQVT